MIKALIYDYDGVISDSVNVKTEAFAELYRQYGQEVEEEVILYHLAHGGISRFEKFKYFHNELLGIDISEPEIDELADRFSKLVLSKVINSPYIPGAYDFINRNSVQFLQFVCTGTPENEIKVILKEKQISQLFHKVHGAPETKEYIISKLLSNYSLKTDEVIFFGDATTDLKAARHHNIKFIGINSDQFNHSIEQYADFNKLNAARNL